MTCKCEHWQVCKECAPELAEKIEKEKRMTTPTPHPFSHVLEPLARDASTQFEMEECGKWRPVSIRYMLEQIAVLGCTEEFRVKPDTIRIGEREVPKPRTGTTGYYISVNAGCANMARVYWETQEDRDAACDAICALLEGRP